MLFVQDLILNANPERVLTLWMRVDFIGYFAAPERGRPLFGQVLRKTFQAEFH
jgi:hypothetical protein